MSNPDIGAKPERLACPARSEISRMSSTRQARPVSPKGSWSNTAMFWVLCRDGRPSRHEPGVWLAVTSISFDISVLELLWTLSRGFKVVLHGEHETDTIAGEILSYGVTHFQSTPSLARMLATNPRFLAALRSLKKLLLGGEALPASLVRTLRGTMTAEIYNMYGPTETTSGRPLTACRIPRISAMSYRSVSRSEIRVLILSTQSFNSFATESRESYFSAAAGCRGVTGNGLISRPTAFSPITSRGRV